MSVQPLRDGFGNEYWQENEQLHRVGGPAMITQTGVRYWFINGTLHRTDGPAIEFPNNPIHDQWCVHGIKVNSWPWFQQLAKISDEELTLLILKYGELS